MKKHMSKNQKVENAPRIVWSILSYVKLSADSEFDIENYSLALLMVFDQNTFDNFHYFKTFLA